MGDSIFETPPRLAEKLLCVQTELKAPKDLYNSFSKFKYRNLEGILESVKPLLGKYGLTLTITDDIVPVGTRVYVKAIATITDGAEVVTTTAWAREPETKKGMDEPQVTGTASSYARKYCLNGLFLIDDTKDPDTDEYARQTGKKPESSRQAPTLDGLRELLESNGIRADFICNCYKVQRLEDLTPAQRKGIENNPTLFRNKQEEADGSKKPARGNSSNG